MLDTVEISLRLLCTIKQEGRNRWVTGCPKLDLFTQGRSEAEAKNCLEEAIALWVEDCFERGMLDQALQECGFQKVHPTDIRPGHSHVVVRSVQEPEGVSGESFLVYLRIPAYQSPVLLAS